MKPIRRAALLAAVGALAIAAYWNSASDPPVTRPSGGESTAVTTATSHTARTATRPAATRPSAAPAAAVPNTRSPLQTSYDTATNLAALLQATHVRYAMATPQQFDAALVKEKALLELIASSRYDEIFPRGA